MQLTFQNGPSLESGLMHRRESLSRLGIPILLTNQLPTIRQLEHKSALETSFASG